MRPSDCKISDALERMKQAHATGTWKQAPEQAASSMVMFMDAVDPDLLSKDEQEFVVGLTAVMLEHLERQAKGGAA